MGSETPKISTDQRQRETTPGPVMKANLFFPSRPTQMTARKRTRAQALREKEARRPSGTSYHLRGGE